jgi:SEC-C motif
VDATSATIPGATGPPREDVSAHVERDFDLELAALEDLEALTDHLLEVWPTKTGTRDEADRIIALAIARGTTTFKAALALIRVGFGREAGMLNRSMFEGMAVAHWVSAEPQVAADRFRKANEFEIHLMREKAATLDSDQVVPSGPGEPDAEELAEAKRLFGPNNDRMWTGHRNIWELVDSIEDQWEEPGRTVLRLYLRFEHVGNTKQMHASASAIFGLALDPVTVREGRTGMTMRIGPGPDWLDGATLGAFFNHSNLLSLLVDHFDLGPEAKSRIEAVTIDNQYAFAVLDPELAHRAGRNDDCPCGSGRKFKKCHWDRARRVA